MDSFLCISKKEQFCTYLLLIGVMKCFLIHLWLKMVWKATVEFVLANQKYKQTKKKQNREKETAVLVCLSASANCQLKRRVLSSSGRCPVCRTGRWTCWWIGSYCCTSWWWCLSRPWGPRHYIATGGKKNVMESTRLAVQHRARLSA